MFFVVFETKNLVLSSLFVRTVQRRTIWSTCVAHARGSLAAACSVAAVFFSLAVGVKT